MSKLPCNIITVLSGKGQRFVDAGFVIPKPYIDIFGTLMFEKAFNSLGINGINNIFVIREEHLKHRDIKKYIENTIPDSLIILEGNNFKGQAFSAYQAKDIVDDDLPLFIINCDHDIQWDLDNFFHNVRTRNADGGLITFYTTDPDPKYSYAKLDDQEKVIEVAEKNKISNYANAGIFFF